jgi:hypothetical protein
LKSTPGFANRAEDYLVQQARIREEEELEAVDSG